MPTIRIPHTAPNRREQTYAQLVKRVNIRGPLPFEGKLFRTGKAVELAELRPTDEWPETPLLIEYAGKDRTGWRRGRKCNDIHILWRLKPAAGAAAEPEWLEITSIKSQGPEWHTHMQQSVLIELRAAPVNFVEVASQASERVLTVLDHELSGLEDEGRGRLLSFLQDQFTARLMAEAA